jgi:hypothetical protein
METRIASSARLGGRIGDKGGRLSSRATTDKAQAGSGSMGKGSNGRVVRGEERKGE